MKKGIIILIIVSIICIASILLFIFKDNNSKTNNIKTKDYEGVLEMIIEVNGKELIVELENNESSKKLLDKLGEKEIKVQADDYGDFEKVGDLGFDLPTNDHTITTTPGDIILYQGNKLCLYYGTNTYSFTKLGHIKDITQEELKELLGPNSVELVLKINKK